jgi:hypothetical protein
MLIKNSNNIAILEQKLGFILKVNNPEKWFPIKTATRFHKNQI